MTTGYQQEDFRWSIAGNIQGTHPDIYSELIWSNISGPACSGALEWHPTRNIVVLSELNFNVITSGKVSDMDYLGNNRTQNSYRGNFKADKGNAQKYNLMIGYKIIATDDFILTPAIGYTIHLQRLYLLKVAENLHSTYTTNWGGFNLRLSALKHLWGRFTAVNDFTAEKLQFSARANWNLMNNFQHPVSFRDEAKGVGINEEFRLGYKLTSVTGLSIGGIYYYSKTGKGVDQLYLKNGETPVTQFNGAVRKAFQVTIGAQFKW